jgi:hypothetical protein
VRAGSFSNTKDIDGETLNTSLVGATVVGQGFYGYFQYPCFDRDSNGMCTILHDLLCDLAKENNRLPPILFLQLDNCGRENKNHAVLGLLAMYIEMGLFQQIYVNFLPVGHTHAKVDQRFSRISVHIRAADLPTMPDMIRKLEGTDPPLLMLQCLCS